MAAKAGLDQLNYNSRHSELFLSLKSQHEITCHRRRYSLFPSPSLFLKVLLQEKLIAKKVLNNGNYRE